MSTQPAHTPPQPPLLLGPDAQAATGPLAALYGETQKVFGYLPGAARLYGISPTLLANQMRHIGHFAQHPTLGAALLAFIRLLVSERAGCDYCIELNAARLINAGVPAETIAAARRDPSRAPLPEREKTLLTFVLSAVADPRRVGAGEIAAVRAQGWSDQEIFEAVHHGAYAVAADILLDTFKVPVD